MLQRLGTFATEMVNCRKLSYVHSLVIRGEKIGRALWDYKLKRNMDCKTRAEFLKVFKIRLMSFRQTVQ